MSEAVTTPVEPPWRASRVRFADVARLQQALGCPEPVAWILVRRGLADPEDARAFLAADGALHDPLTIDGVGAAAQRLVQALRRQERVAVHGDYDCDGVCATAILAGALRARGGDCLTFIPSRFTDGYGVSEATVERLAGEGATVLVTVDCGTANVEALTRAHELGMDVVVLDHHLAAGARPPGILVNPALGQGMDPLPSAAGVVFDVTRAMSALMDAGDLLAPGPEAGVDLAGLATVADSMQLVEGNRRLVRHALDAIRQGGRPGINALLRVAGSNHRSVTPRALSFTLAPAINAAGRLGDASRALDLLLATDDDEAIRLARELWDCNEERKGIERQVTAEATAMVLAEPVERRDVPITLVAGEGWHEGVVGIVASRLVERFGRPAIVLATSDGDAKGSGRSMQGVDLHAIVGDADGVLTRWGGHSGAVGVSLATDDVPRFREALEESAAGRRRDIARARTRTVDAVVAGADLTLATAEALEALAPFGRGNPEPVVVIPGCAVANVSKVGGGRHLKARLAAGGVTAPAIGFGMGEGDGAAAITERGEAARYDAIARIEVERWQDTVGARVSLQELVHLPDGPDVPGACAVACDVACGARVSPTALRALVDAPFIDLPDAPAPVPPALVVDHRGEGRMLPMITALAGADDGVVAVVCDVPRRRAALGDVLAPGRLGVEVAVLGGDRCDVDAMRGRLALARGGPVLAMVDYRALAALDLPPAVNVVLVDPPVQAAHVTAARMAGAGRAVHLAWGEAEAAHALRVVEDDLAVRATAAAIWPVLRDAPGPLPWDTTTTALLAGDGPVARSPRALAAALTALRDAGLVALDDRGITTARPDGRADLDATPTGLHAAALCDQARTLAGRAMTVDLFAHPLHAAGALT